MRRRKLALITSLVAVGIAGAQPARAVDPRLVAAGDIGCEPGHEPRPDYCQMAATAKQVQELAPEVVAALGDNQYESGTLAEFNAVFDRTWGAFKPLIRPAAGNHEYETPDAAGYFAYFGAAAGDPSKGYYSYDLGAWHVVVLNSNCEFVACEAGSAQERWLRADLAAHPSECTLAYWHHPLFSSGPLKREPNDLAMKPIWDDLYAAGADLVLNGHDHDYERFAQQSPDGLPDPGRGIREIVVGTGGDDLFRFFFIYPNSESRQPTPGFGVLAVGLHARSYDWRFHSLTGAYGDSGSTRCASPGRPPRASARVARDRLARVLARGLRVFVRSRTTARVQVALQLDPPRADKLGFPRSGNALELGNRALKVRAKRRAIVKIRLNAQARRRLPRFRATPIRVVVLVGTRDGGRRVISRSLSLRP